MKVTTRKVRLNSNPAVEAEVHADRIVVSVNGWMGESVFINARGELSVYCAKHLILNLRKALRRVRDEKTAILNAQVLEAERPL